MHDHHHHHHHGSDGHHHPHLPGHNGPAGAAAQWQTPHLPHDHTHVEADPRHADLDLVEEAFIEGFSRAPDTASFLRLSGIPFVGETPDGNRLHLLRVETELLVDVGGVTPLIGGAGVRYDPLPVRLTSQRRRLSFVYHDGTGTKRIGFSEARALEDRTTSSQISFPGR